jgi:hypothetical protein
MKRTKPRTLALGSYSSGTMRPEDLIPAFISAAEDLRLTREDRRKLEEIRREYDKVSSEDYDVDAVEAVEPDDLCTDLFDLLDCYTPDYCYFGAHPGDGADYGVWIVEDLLRDTRDGSYDGCVFRSEMTPGEMRAAASNGHANGIMYDSSTRQHLNRQYSHVRKTYSHWLHVNDHGNCTLYRRAGNRWIEVWSVV